MRYERFLVYPFKIYLSKFATRIYRRFLLSRQEDRRLHGTCKKIAISFRQLCLLVRSKDINMRYKCLLAYSFLSSPCRVAIMHISTMHGYLSRIFVFRRKNLSPPRYHGVRRIAETSAPWRSRLRQETRRKTREACAAAGDTKR